MHPKIGEVDLLALVVRQIVRVDRERPREQLAFANEHRAAFNRLIEPLVRVERHRIGQLDARQRRAAPLTQGGESTVCSIDVEPQPAVAADLRQLTQAVDRASVGRTCVRGYDQRLAARPGVGLDRTQQSVVSPEGH